MRPVRDALDIAMLLGVDMDIVDTAAQMVFVANEPFPVTPLPDASLGLGLTACAQALAGWDGT